MKLNMKRVVLGLSMAACIFALSACSKADSASEEIDAGIQAQMEQLPGALLEQYTQLDDEQIVEIKNQADLLGDTSGIIEGLDSWVNIREDLGALKSVEEAVEMKRIEGGYMATVKAEFEKRSMEFSITMDSQLSDVTSVSFVPEYTVAENLEKAALNTLMGMGTVFLVLIFISLLISCFKYINQYEAKMKGAQKEKPVLAPPPAVSAPVVEEEENLADDLELVAVITAAIAASTGSSPSGLVVRSIKRAPAGKWKKA